MRWRPLFGDHVALGREGLVREAQIAHPVRFHAHDQLEPVAGDALVVGGVVPGGEGVVVAAIARNGARKLARRNLPRALEHQVFEEMGDAGMAARLIGSADTIPDHVRDHGRAAIGNHHDLQAIAQREALGPRQFARDACAAQRKQQRQGGAKARRQPMHQQLRCPEA